MHVTFVPTKISGEIKNILQIDEARITHKNFEGREEKYNRKGDRNFSVIIPDRDIADALIKDGWNVRIRDPREEGDEPFMYLPVKVNFNSRGPRAYLKSGNRTNELDEESIKLLDDVDIINVDLDIRPYDWEVNGKTGRKAYLESIHVEQRVDRFAERHANV